MEGTWRWLFSISLAVSWASTDGDIEENIPFQTLSCHNDFTTRTICQWEEVAAVQQYFNLSLYYQRFNDDIPMPVSCDRHQNTTLPTCQFPSCIPRTCFIHHNFFVGSQIDLFSFKINRPLEILLSVNLAQSFRPPTPENLTVTHDGIKYFLLSWEMPHNWNQSLQSSQSGLEFEVAYKRQWESWEEASTMNSNMSHVLLGHDRLIPDNHYVARVRVMTSGGRPSLWSSEVSWESQAGDEAQPKNLQCFFDGYQQLLCTWEVRAEVTSSVSFGLSYKVGPSAMKECTSVSKERSLGSPYVRYRCQIHVQDPIHQSQYTVMVQTKNKNKSIQSYQNIKPQSPSIMSEKKEDSYLLKWQIPKMAFSIEHIFEVQYRKSTQSWKEAHTETLSIILKMHISKKSLDPATQYFARVRSRVSPKSYHGTWSEWSNECTWTTDNVFPSWILPLVLIIITVLVVLGAWCCCTFGVRLKTNWESKIPNPSKSHLFQNKNKIWIPSNHLTFSQESLWKKDRECSISRVDGFDVGDTRSSVSPLTTVDPEDAYSLCSDPDPYPASITLPDENQSLSSFQEESEPRTVKDIPVSFDMNGPYLHLPQSHSLPNITDQKESRQAEESKKQPHGSLEYFFLPQDGQGGLVPMAKLAEPGRDRKGTSSAHPSDREEPEPVPLKEQATHPSRDSEPKKNLSQPDANSKGPLKLTVGSGYLAPEDLILGSGKPESLQSLVLPSSSCSDPESSLSLSLGETKELPSTASPSILAFEGYVEAPTKMAITEIPPEHPSSLQVDPPAPNPKDAQQDDTITVFHPNGLIVLQQVGDYCFFPSQSQLVSPGHCPEKMVKPQDIQAKEPPSQSRPQVPAIQLFKAMKQQDYLALPTWDGCRPGQVC